MLSNQQKADCMSSLYEFTKVMFKARKGADFMCNWHHEAICNALEKVVTGQTTRLIINIPPRGSKTEIAVVNFIAWATGLFPNSEWIHASYSKRIAANNTYNARELMSHETYNEIFPWIGIRSDSSAKDEFRTSQGGVIYATGSEGSITGYGAGAMNKNEFRGCFAEHQMVNTEHEQVSIGDIVNSNKDFKVWSYDESKKERVLSNVTRKWKNPSNDIIRVLMSDGSYIDCTPDHEILTEAGWVSAIHLSKSLNLMDTEPCDFARFSSSDTSISGDFYRFFGVLLSLSPVGVRKMLCDRFPSLSELNLPNNPYSDTVSICENGSAIEAIEYFNNLFSSEFCTGSSFKEWECPVPYSVLHVVGLSAIREIAKVVVGRVSVEMSNLIPVGAFTYKLLSDEMSDVSTFDNTINGEINPEVTMGIPRRLKKSNGLCPSDLSSVRNLVKPIGSSNVFPVGVFYAGHAENTFCLEVEGVHNFELSHSGAIVSNCIIVDDPHKAGEADSDISRQNVLDWFQTTLESRKNNPDTPIIVIMQRLHESDLAGWLINGGNGEDWETLIIPAINEDGSSFWEEKFPIEMLRRLEKSNSYVFAGQYMQEPSPKTGGHFEPSKIEIVDALPKGLRFIRGWDLASTIKKTSDYTSSTKLAIDKDGVTWISEVDRFKGTPDIVENTILMKAKLDKKETFISIPQDPGQAGVAQKASMSKKLNGYSFEFTPESGDKVSRSSPFAAQVNAGNVRMLKGDWNEEFLSELKMFPRGSHDDQVDSTSRAYNKALEKPVSVFDVLF